MSNPWDSFPPIQSPIGYFIAPFDAGQGASTPPPPQARFWPFVEVDSGPEGLEILRQWAEPHAARAESRRAGLDEMPAPPVHGLQQMAAETRRINSLMAVLAETSLAT